MGYPSGMNANPSASHSAYDSPEGLDPQGMKGDFRSSTYLIVAIIAFVAGMLAGNLRATTRGGSRIEWPSQESLRPHPRSLQQ